MDNYEDDPMSVFYPPDILVGRMEQLRLLVLEMDEENTSEQHYFLTEAAKLLLDSCYLTESKTKHPFDNITKIH